MGELSMGSIFSGASGSDCGLQQEGFELRFAVELNRTACDTYERNLGHRPYCGDAETFLSYAHLFKENKGLDLLVGGPPCQSFSNANSSSHVSMIGMNNILTYLKYVELFKPKYFLMEEAPTFLERRLMHISQEIMRLMVNLGYDVAIYQVNTEDYGIPQNRIRTFFVGTERGRPRLGLPPQYHWGKTYTGWADYLKDTLGSKVSYDNYDQLLAKCTEVKGRTILEPSYTVMASQTMAIRKAGQPLAGIKLSSAQRQRHKINQRYLSVLEAQVLQGFPPDYFFCGNMKEQMIQVGNAWSVNVARAWGKEVKRCLQYS